MSRWFWYKRDLKVGDLICIRDFDHKYRTGFIRIFEDLESLKNSPFSSGGCTTLPIGQNKELYAMIIEIKYYDLSLDEEETKEEIEAIKVLCGEKKFWINAFDIDSKIDIHKIKLSTSSSVTA